MDAVGPLISPLLIGREDVLALAQRRLDEVAAGSGQFLLVAGEAGIGKTRVLRTIRGEAVDRGFRIAQADLAPQDHDLPAASILDLARTCTVTPDLEALGSELLSLRDAPALAERSRRRMLVVDVVERVRAGLVRPTAFVFEDLQWADDVSLEIIAELARRTRDLPLLLIAAYRSEETPPGTSLRDWRSRLLTQRIAEEVRLAPFDLEQTALVTSLILDTGLPAPREVVAAVYERTDGVPLHIEELLGAMSAQARADGRAIREARVPETIEDAVLERIGLRSPAAQAVARAGAVIGRCFIPDVLAGIMDVPPHTLDDPLQELLDHGVLYPAGSYIDFRHQLLRDAIYRSVPLRDRRRFHARAAEFGARLEGQAEVHASLHYERAGMHRQAFESALAGAHRAAALAAHREAFELFRRAVANSPTDLSDSGRAELMDAFASEAASIEEQALAERSYNEAAKLHRAAGEPVRAIISTAVLLAMWRRDARPASDRLALGHRLLAELDGVPDGPDSAEARVTIATELARTHAETFTVAEARRWIEMARTAALATGDPEWPVAVDWYECLVRFNEGHHVGALARLADIAREAEQAGYESTAVGSMRDLGTLSSRVLAYEDARRWIGGGLRYADSIEQSHCAHVMTATSAMIDWSGGDWSTATDMAYRAITDRGCTRAATSARCALGYLAMGRGDLATAEAELAAALEVGETSEALELILPPSWGLAETVLLGGEPERAAERCRQAFLRVEAVGERPMLIPFVVTGVRAELAAGRPTAGMAWLDACEQFLASGELPIAAANVAVAHGRGLLALANGSTGVARDLLGSAIRGWDEQGRVWEASWARVDLASALIRAGRFVDAARIGAEVRATASRLDSPSLAARTDAVLRLARGHTAVEVPWHPLTAREFEVARLIGEGRTNAEIAADLGIAPKTAISTRRAHPVQARGVTAGRDRDVDERGRWSPPAEPGAPPTPQPSVGRLRRYNPCGTPTTLTRTRPAHRATRPPPSGGSASWPTASPTADRPHQAAKRYIYAWGDGRAEGDAAHARPARWQGRGPRRDDQRRPPDAARASRSRPRPATTTSRPASASRTASGTTSSRRSRRSSGSTGKGFGDPANPLLVSVRSGAKFSMPGMMDTVLNLGLNEADAAGPRRADRQRALRLGRLPALHPDVRADRHGGRAASASTTPSMRPRSATGRSQDTDLDAAALRDLVGRVQGRSSAPTPARDFPERPERAARPRHQGGVRQLVRQARPATTARTRTSPTTSGTAVNVVTMVFGNMGDDSGTGVAFTRDPNTGEKVLFGEYLTNAQGEDVVAGIRTAPKISQMQTEMPEVYAEFQRIGQQLETHYRDVQDLEFTIERGRLYMLQTRERQAHRGGGRADRRRTWSTRASSRKEEAVARVEPAHVDQLLRDQFDPAALKAATAHRQGPQRLARARPSVVPCSTPTPRSSGSTTGEKVVLVRIETSPDDFHGMAVAQGILTARGGATSATPRSSRARSASRASPAAPSSSSTTHAKSRAQHRDRRRRSPRATGSASTARPARSTWARCPTVVGPVRGPARPPEGPRLGRRDPAHGRLDQRRQARGGRPGPRLRRRGHRPVPDRAHVPRGRAARDRARRDPRRASRRPVPRRELAAGEETRRGRAARSSRASTPRWASSRCSSRATSRASSRRWTACRSSSGSSTRRSTSSCPTSRSSSSR